MKFETAALKFVLLFTGFFGVQVLQAQSKILYTTPQPPGFAARKLSKQEVASDMVRWQTIMEQSHVNLYHAISKTELDALRDAALASLPDSVTHAQAAFAISRLIGSVNEGHLGFATNSVADSLYSNEAVRFPFLLQAIAEDGAFVVQRDLSGLNKLPAGSRIVSVNGVPAATLYQRYRAYYGGLEAWRRETVRNNIRKLLFLDGFQSPFTVAAEVDGKPLSFVAPGFTSRHADSINKILMASATAPKPFSLRYTPENVAVIDFNDMDRSLRDSFAAFLQTAFAEIKQREPKGLVIDLRRNGGGDSELGEMLLSYITDKPYRSVSSVKLRISEHGKGYAALFGSTQFKDTENGTLLENKIDKLKKPGKNALRYQGKIAVLIGRGTFSSANMLANAIVDYNLAATFGEPTAEPGNDYGEMISFMLPNTRIVTRAATKMFARANGDERDFGGIRPQFEMMPKPGVSGDAAMEAALRWISGQ